MHADDDETYNEL